MTSSKSIDLIETKHTPNHSSPLLQPEQYPSNIQILSTTRFTSQIQMDNNLPLLNITPVRLFEILTTSTVALHTGCIAYITIIEAPSRATLSGPQQLRHWRTTFTNAMNLFKPLGLILFPTLLSCAAITGKQLYYVAAVPFALLGPFTISKIVPINTRLLNMPMPEEGSEEAGDVIKLTTKWARLHSVRVAMSVVGFTAAIWTCTTIVGKYK